MRIILSGGGTAGHIYPALALAAELKSRGHTLVYVGTPEGPEARLAPAAGLEFIEVKAAGYDRARPLTIITSSLVILRSARALRRFFVQWHPDVVVGFGGYVAIPVGLAAHWSREEVPLVIHEQNSVPGMANRWLARFAQMITLTYPQSAKRFREHLRPGANITGQRPRIFVTGDPVRPEILTANGLRGRDRLKVADEALLLLVFGGSRGARHLNEALLRVLPDLQKRFPQLYTIHVSGPSEYEDLQAKTKDFERYQLYSYLDDIGDVLAAADLALTRAGATSIAELSALGVPAILVPFPHATDDHQTSNARDLVAEGGAVMLPDEKLDDADFKLILEDLLSDERRRDTMAKAARAFGRPQAATLLADCIETAALNGQKD